MLFELVESLNLVLFSIGCAFEPQVFHPLFPVLLKPGFLFEVLRVEQLVIDVERADQEVEDLQGDHRLAAEEEDVAHLEKEDDQGQFLEGAHRHHWFVEDLVQQVRHEVVRLTAIAQRAHRHEVVHFLTA